MENTNIILEQPYFCGMFNMINLGIVMEVAHTYTHKELMKKKEDWIGKRTDMYKITNIGPIEKFMADYNFSIDVIVGNDSLKEKDITNAVNYFLSHIEEMEDIAVSSLYQYYTENYTIEYQKAYNNLSKRFGVKNAKEMLDSLSENTFRDFMLASIYNLVITDDGYVGMDISTDWGTTILIYFYDIKRNKQIDIEIEKVR